MAFDNLSPNVGFQEQDASQEIPSVTSSVCGAVIHALKGPVNELVLLTNPTDLQNIFGIADDINYTHWFNVEAALKVTNQFYAVRTEVDTKAVAGLTVGLSATGLGSLILSTDTTKQVVQFPLDYSDIKLNEAKINYGLPAGTGVGDLDNPANALYTEDVYHFYGIGAGTYYDEISIAVINAADYTTLVDMKDMLNESYTQDNVNTIASMFYNGTVGTTAMSGDDYLSNSLIKYDVIIPPTGGGTDWFVNTGLLATLTSFEVGPDTADEGVLIVFDENGNPQEQYLFSNNPTATDALGNNLFGPKLVNGNSNYIYFFIGNSQLASPGLPVLTTGVTYLGGADLLTGQIPGTGLADLTGEILTQLESYFSNPEALSIDILIDLDYEDPVKQYLDQLSSTIRMDCIAIQQVPLEYMLSPDTYNQIANPYTSMKNYVANILNINSSYSCIYGNYFLIYDRFAEINRWVPVTGYVAAVMAYTDFNDAQWFAPAGLNRGVISNVIDVAVNPNKGQRDILYYNRINPIPKFQGDGIVIWGQKTMQSGATAFDRINVRRLFLYLEKTITKLARQFLFEFNDDNTRSRFRGLVNPFLTNVKAGRGVYDFLVICDTTNNTPDVIDANQFVGAILVKPERVAEFINLTFVAVATGVDFSEVVVNS